MQVQLVDAYAEFAPDGQPLDYRADLVIYRRGDEVMRCSSTVNTPCKYDGYRFYQVAYFGYGAEVVRCATSPPATSSTTRRWPCPNGVPSPHLEVRDGETVLLDETVLLTDNVDTGEGALPRGARAAGGRPRADAVAAEMDGGDLLVFEPASGEAVRARRWRRARRPRPGG